MLRVGREGENVLVETEHLTFALRKEAGGYVQYLSARRAPSGPCLRSERGRVGGDGPVAPVYQKVTVMEEARRVRLTLQGSAAGHDFSSTVDIGDSANYVQVHVEDRLAQPTRMEGIRSSYELAHREPDFVFAPYIRPFDDYVIGQSAFKAPGIAWLAGGTLVMVVADVEDLNRARPPIPAYLDFDADLKAPRVGYGLISHRPSGTLYFSHTPGEQVEVGAGRLQYGYYLVVRDDVLPEDAAGALSRFVWERFAPTYLDGVRPQVAPFDTYAHRGLRYALGTLWSNFEIDGEPCGGIRSGLGKPNDVWFQNQHNALDSARALALFGRRWKDEALTEKADRVKNLLLKSPVDRGLFLTIFNGEIRTGVMRPQWYASHWMWWKEFSAEFGLIARRSQARLIDWDQVYHTVSCSTTAHTMLIWYQEIDADARLLDRCRAYADYLLTIQQQTGSIPSWVYRGTLEIEGLFKENVDAACSGMFLAELYRVTREAKYLTAARRVAEFILERVRPEQRWQDYETCFDSLAKPVGFFDHHTHQYAQATGGIYWTSEMLGTLFQTTGEEIWRTEGARVADYLSLFQSVWRPHFVSMDCFGGFCVGNGHPAWNDARQQLFGRLFLRYYMTTRDPMYFQRGLAAIRASLALMYMPENKPVSAWYADGPEGWSMENCAHRGQDRPAISSSYDWGVGNLLTSLGTVLEQFGSVLVDVDHERAFGVDGTSVHDCEFRGPRVALRLVDEVGGHRPITVTVLSETHREVELVINGTSYRTGALEGGKARVVVPEERVGG